jgi:ATP-dependent Lon protease
MKVWSRKHKADDKVRESKFIDIMNTTEEFQNETRYLKEEDVPDLFDFSNNETDSELQARELYKYIVRLLQMKDEELKFNSMKDMENARADEVVDHEFVPTADDILNFCRVVRHLNRTVVKEVLERAHDYEISQLKFQRFLDPEVDVKSNVISDRASKAYAIFSHVQDEERLRVTLSQCRQEVERIVALVRKCGNFLRIQKTIKLKFERNHTRTQHELLRQEHFQDFMYCQVDGYRDAKYRRKKRTLEIKQEDLELIPIEELNGTLAQGVWSKEAELSDNEESEDTDYEGVANVDERSKVESASKQLFDIIMERSFNRITLTQFKRYVAYFKGQLLKSKLEDK